MKDYVEVINCVLYDNAPYRALEQREYSAIRMLSESITEIQNYNFRNDKGVIDFDYVARHSLIDKEYVEIAYNVLFRKWHLNRVLGNNCLTREETLINSIVYLGNCGCQISDIITVMLEVMGSSYELGFINVLRRINQQLEKEVI
jgi:hypothetical protein